MKTTRKAPAIEIRHCHALKEFEGCVYVQQRTWGGDQVVPVPVLVVASHTGGQVLGAFEQGRLVGFTLALAGVGDGYYLHSHMAAVLPEYRDQGIGRQLKLAQREDALARGIERIEWTFDPLEVKNAYLNLNKLGAVARRLLPNCYGVTQSPLHHGLPTDRLLAEWWLASPRVSGMVSSNRQEGPLPKNAKRVAMPKDWEHLRREDRAAAAEAQADIRRRLEELFAEGYAVVGIDRNGNKAEFLLVRLDKIQGLRLPEQTKPALKRGGKRREA